jgi:hypothetical protein
MKSFGSPQSTRVTDDLTLLTVLDTVDLAHNSSPPTVYYRTLCGCVVSTDALFLSVISSVSVVSQSWPGGITWSAGWPASRHVLAAVRRGGRSRSVRYEGQVINKHLPLLSWWLPAFSHLLWTRYNFSPATGVGECFTVRPFVWQADR